ncbi:hypothetical protein [Chitinilyticum aquatile]|uniref:hypothetical protein n=1 Tax=Chitinilyticum aquatile TaxID=362520 RepID=UPI00048E911C|nr:hypothetical protein [Chitinilyticum aquatile]
MKYYILFAGGPISISVAFYFFIFMKAVNKKALPLSALVFLATLLILTLSFSDGYKPEHVPTIPLLFFYYFVFWLPVTATLFFIVPLAMIKAINRKTILTNVLPAACTFIHAVIVTITCAFILESFDSIAYKDRFSMVDLSVIAIGLIIIYLPVIIYGVGSRTSRLS